MPLFVSAYILDGFINCACVVMYILTLIAAITRQRLLLPK